MKRDRETGTWLVDVSFDGRRIRRFFKTEAEAIEFEAKTRLDYSQHAILPQAAARKHNPLLIDFCEQWLERRHAEGGYAPGSMGVWKNHVDRYIVPKLGRYPLLGVNNVWLIERTLREWPHIGKKPNRCSPAYANAVLGTLVMILADAVRFGLLPDNKAVLARRLKISVADSHKPIEPSAIYSKDELRRLIEVTPAGTVHRVFVMLLAFTGVRIGEALKLKWSAIDLKEGTLAVESRTGPKTPSAVRVFRNLPSALLHELRQWRLRCPGDDLILVFATTGNAMDRKTTWKILKRYEVAAGIAPRSHHALRHTFASHLLLDGVPDIEVAYLMGHKNSAITRRVYAHFLPKTHPTAVADLAGSILQAKGDL